MFKKYIALLLLSITLVCTAGCGKENEELKAFEENMNTFYTEITAIGASMDSLDVQSEDAAASLQAYLGEMASQFDYLASLEVPAEFSSIEELADDAAEYMNEAVMLYNQAYEEDSVNLNYVDAASKNYESAMKRVNYIASLLQGEIPEGATVIEGDGAEFEPYTE